jgi:DNA end-binding protein Ku
VIEDVEEPGASSGKSNVINLMAALKASVEGKKQAPDKPATAKPAPKRRRG